MCSQGHARICCMGCGQKALHAGAWCATKESRATCAEACPAPGMYWGALAHAPPFITGVLKTVNVYAVDLPNSVLVCHKLMGIHAVFSSLLQHHRRQSHRGCSETRRLCPSRTGSWACGVVGAQAPGHSGCC